MNSKILALGLLTCLLLFMTSSGLVIQPRCRCTAIQKSQIRQQKIQKFLIIPPGPHCKNLEVIATVKFQKEVEICVNPNAKWVQDAMEKMGLTKSFSADMKSIV